MRYGATELAKYWTYNRSQWEKARSTGLVLIYVYSNGRIRVVSPYHKDWLSKATELNGRWRVRTKSWTFDISVIRSVVDACIHIYGRDKVKVVDNRHTAL